ncbi:hypothetical protein DFP72DRAFT_861131 [Ephemerocybe angulata]|uniref:Uncharacterized protein n=1 Tax=Ephemerocybe angulata TaxID=980116 RepID=A0A8H6H9J5_9AGAR|nr:hypothetical protein DFP72DRAFT_861131 [Tulosesus angulatus]
MAARRSRRLAPDHSESSSIDAAVAPPYPGEEPAPPPYTGRATETTPPTAAEVPILSGSEHSSPRILTPNPVPVNTGPFSFSRRMLGQLPLSEPRLTPPLIPPSISTLPHNPSRRYGTGLTNSQPSPLTPITQRSITFGEFVEMPDQDPNRRNPFDNTESTEQRGTRIPPLFAPRIKPENVTTRLPAIPELTTPPQQLGYPIIDATGVKEYLVQEVILEIPTCLSSTTFARGGPDGFGSVAGRYYNVLKRAEEGLNWTLPSGAQLINPEARHFFKAEYQMLDEVLTHVHKYVDEGRGTGYRINIERWKPLAARMFEVKNSCKEALLASGEGIIELPKWGRTGRMTDVWSINDFEILSVAFRAEVEQFFSTVTRAVTAMAKVQEEYNGSRSSQSETHGVTNKDKGKGVGEGKRHEYSQDNLRKPSSATRVAPAASVFEPLYPEHYNGIRPAEERSISSRVPGVSVPRSINNPFLTSAQSASHGRLTNPETFRPLGNITSSTNCMGGAESGSQRYQEMLRPMYPEYPSQQAPQPHNPVLSTPGSQVRFDTGNDGDPDDSSSSSESESGRGNRRRGSRGLRKGRKRSNSHGRDSQYWMNRVFMDKQKMRANKATYRDQANPKETPSEYFIQKLNLLQLTYNYNDRELIQEIMNGVPTTWTTIVTPHLYLQLEDFQANIKYHEELLMKLDSLRSYFGNFGGNTRGYSRNPFMGGYRNNPAQARTNLVGAHDKLPPPQFPKDDENVSKRGTPVSKGGCPCRHCGSGNHWDYECKHSRRGERRARANFAEDEADAQAAYDELYYNLETQLRAYLCVNCLKGKQLAQALNAENSALLDDPRTLVMRKLQARPPGCTFLGAKAMEHPYTRHPNSEPARKSNSFKLQAAR